MECEMALHSLQAWRGWMDSGRDLDMIKRLSRGHWNSAKALLHLNTWFSKQKRAEQRYRKCFPQL